MIATSITREHACRALSPQIMELVILPTENCNFRCVYCYEHLVPGRMSAGTVAGIKSLIDRRVTELKFLRLSWFGGEPLTTKHIVFDVAEHAFEACKQYGTVLAGDMTTNGYLLSKATAERLCAVNHSEFFVSLAGVGEAHDRHRPLASGKGSFERIWNNLKALQDSELAFDMSLRLHFGTDLGDCEELCRLVNRQFAGDERFKVSLQRIADLGGPNTGRFGTLTVEDGQRAIDHLATLLHEVHVSNLDPEEPLICAAARPNNFLIRADGRITRCTAHLDDPRATVGRIEPDGRLSIDNDRLRPWFKGFDNFDERMLSCPYAAVPASAWSQTAEARRIPVRVQHSQPAGF